MSQLRFACALQLPWQLAWQPPEQVGGEAVHVSLQRALMLAEHWAVQVVMSSADMQLAAQLPIASISHEPWQSKLPGVQLTMQEASQLVMSQLTLASAVQPPEQLASSWAEHAAAKLIGIH